MFNDDIIRAFLARWLLEWGDSEVSSGMLYAEGSWYAPHHVPSFRSLQFVGMFETKTHSGRGYTVRITEAGLNFIKGEANHVGNIEQLPGNP